MGKATLSKVLAAIKYGRARQLARMMKDPRLRRLINVVWNFRHVGGKPFLHWAAMHELDREEDGRLQVAEVLIRNGANLLLTDFLGRNVGHEAARRLNTTVLEVLRRQDPNILRSMLGTEDHMGRLAVEYVPVGLPDDEPDESQQARGWMLDPVVFSEAALYSESKKVLIFGWAEEAEVYASLAAMNDPSDHLLSRPTGETEIMRFARLLAIVYALLRDEDGLDATTGVDFYYAVHMLVAILDRHLQL